jgi:hypothetical protein
VFPLQLMEANRRKGIAWLFGYSAELSTTEQHHQTLKAKAAYVMTTEPKKHICSTHRWRGSLRAPAAIIAKRESR